MSALPQSFLDQQSALCFERMDETNLNEVTEIEIEVFPFFWTREVFRDTITAGYECWVARDASNVLVGYFVLMPVIDEAQLLTIAVRADLQGQGIGRKLLDRVIALAREIHMLSLLLEVRPSNSRALEMYQRYGFTQIGLRKNYYEAPKNTREDGLVMRMVL